MHFTRTTFKHIIQILAIGFLLSACGGSSTSTPLETASNKVLKAIGSSESNITFEQLKLISPELTGVQKANIDAYQAYIEKPDNNLSSPIATIAQVQAMINAVNIAVVNSNAVLEAIGANDANESNITLAEFAKIFPELEDIIEANLEDYQAYIRGTDNNFSSPAKRDQVQTMIKIVNSNIVLIAIGTDANESNITLTELTKIFPPLTGIVGKNLAAYQTYIQEDNGTFSPIATKEQVQTMINIVNTNIVLTQIGQDHNASESNISLEDLDKIFPALDNINEVNLEAYQAYIGDSANDLSNPATRTQVQRMIYTVNDAVSDLVLETIGKENNANESNITLAELKKILPVLIGIIDTNEAAYQAYIQGDNDRFTATATQAQVQSMIYTANSNVVLTQIGEDHYALESNVSIDELNHILPALYRLNENNIEEYRAYIEDLANDFSSPAQRDQVQAMINTVNSATSIAVLRQIGKEDDANESNVTVMELSQISPMITGLIEKNEQFYQIYIADPINTFSTIATPDQVQAMIAPVNAAVARSELTLKNIGDQDDANNSNFALGNLKTILPKITEIVDAYLGQYRAYIADPVNPFSSPATQKELQAMVLAVNASQAALIQIGEEDDANVSNISIEALNNIFPALTSVVEANEAAYRAYIADANNTFSATATKGQVQTMINAVNSDAALAKIVANASGVTFEELSSILPMLTAVIEANEAGYQAYLEDSNNTFAAPNTLEKVQNMVYEVNSIATLREIGEDHKNNELNVTFEELSRILGLRDLNEAYEEDYQEYFKNPSNNLDNPATLDQIQDIIDLVNAGLRPLPENMTIDASNLTSYIASTYDDTPYSPAIDLQGMINMNLTARGKPVKVPYTVLNEPVTLRAYSTSVSIENTSTEDNESGIVATFYWPETNLSVGSGTFDAYISIDDRYAEDDGVYRAKKLDLEDNASGFTAASFAYATSSGDDMGTLRLQVIPGIPDRMYGRADNANNSASHKFVYLTITSPITGRTWLNNNLGAEYANTNSAYFNPAQQATSFIDYRAYGSLFQWGRKADGHELVSWSSDSYEPGVRGIAVHGTTAVKATSNTPTDTLFIDTSSTPYDWRKEQNNTLWASEASPNNVCPQGYRLPLNPNNADDASNEFYVEIKTWDNRRDDDGVWDALASSFNSVLVLPSPGLRSRRDGLFVSSEVTDGYYWFGSTTGTSAHYIAFNHQSARTNDANYRGAGYSVRCIKDQNATDISNTILAIIGTADNDANASNVRIEALYKILPALEDINDSKQEAYQAYIVDSNNSFETIATRDEVQEMIDAVNVSQEVLVKIGKDSDKSDSNITIAQLSSILTLRGVIEANEEAYQAYIADPINTFETPARLEEVQAMVIAVNASQEVLRAIGAEDANESNISIAQLQDIFPALATIIEANVEAYQAYIRQDPNNTFASPATQDQVQMMVNEVNSNTALIQIGEEDDANNSNISSTELKLILDLRDVIEANEADYQAYIANPINTFETSATLEEVQAMITEVNTVASNIVLDKIEANASNVSIAELSKILPRLTDILKANEADYQAYIFDVNDEFEALDTQAKVQAMIHTVNSNVVLREIGEDHVNNASDVTIKELSSILGLTDIMEVYEEVYQAYIADPTNIFSSPALLSEVQYIITAANARPAPLVENITINDSNLTSSIIAIYDTSYSSGIIDIGAKIETNATSKGMLVEVPYTVVNEAVTLPAYSSTPFRIARSSTEDNESGILATFYWDETNLSVGSGTFNAYISIDDTASQNPDGVYNVKKRSIEENEFGFTAASFLYPSNSGAGIGTLRLQVVPGIFDRMYGIADNNGDTESHKFLYLPITNPDTGRTWLSNNLGAEYANINSADFNLTQQATNSRDHLAYGSLFQWGRKADGHELIKWTNSSSGTAVHADINYTQSDDPEIPFFIHTDQFAQGWDWREERNASLWASEASPNNVCPKGYRLPLNPNTEDDDDNEFYIERTYWDSRNAAGAFNSPLKLTTTGRRYIFNNGAFVFVGSVGYYWTGSVSIDAYTGVINIEALIMWFNSSVAWTRRSQDERVNGQSVRCIKD